MKEGTSTLFELELSLPNARLKLVSERLIGFRRRYDRLHKDLLLLIDKEGLLRWSEKQYAKKLPLLDSLLDRSPLVVFHGDVGTGKTATAEAVSNELAKDMAKDAMLFKLSTRVRGSGNVGEMSTQINQAFDVVGKEAGKAKFSFLIIDEADSLAATRSAKQSHHEDKVAVNTLIQKIDDVRRYNGRVLVILCTNHFESIDPAILRRAAYIEEFRRPDEQERREIIELDCAGLELAPDVIEELVRLTGPNDSRKLGHTFSDIRTRIIPEALGQAYPARKIKAADLIEAATNVLPARGVIPSTDA